MAPYATCLALAILFLLAMATLVRWADEYVEQRAVDRRIARKLGRS